MLKEQDLEQQNNNQQIIYKKVANPTDVFINKVLKPVSNTGAFLTFILGVLMLFPDFDIWIAELLGYKPGMIIKVELRKLLPFFGYLVLTIAALLAVISYLLHKQLKKAAFVKEQFPLTSKN